VIFRHLLVKAVFFFTQFFILLLLYNIYQQTNHPHKTYIHKTIYIDRSFNEEERGAIVNAAAYWMIDTNHIAEFNIVEFPSNVDPMLNKNNTLIITKISSDYPTVIGMDRENKQYTLAYYSDGGILPAIYLIEDRMPDKQFQAIVMHEIGHALGLEHLNGDDNIGTLMYPTSDFMADHITKKDLVEFCQIYSCSADQL
jgi:hypothetical protein